MSTTTVKPTPVPFSVIFGRNIKRLAISSVIGIILVGMTVSSPKPSTLFHVILINCVLNLILDLIRLVVK